MPLYVGGSAGDASLADRVDEGCDLIDARRAAVQATVPEAEGHVNAV